VVGLKGAVRDVERILFQLSLYLLDSLTKATRRDKEK
jgi:hypothetical protein